MAIDLSKIENRKKIIEQIKSDDNKKRKATSLRQFRVYSDLLDQYVQERILQCFSRETFKMMPVISSINLAKRIVDQSSTIYNMPCERSFTGLTEESEMAVEEIYKDGMADTKLMRANRFYKLQHQNHLYLKLTNGKIEFIPFLNHNIDVIPKDENPEEAYCYIISNFDRTTYNQGPTNYSQVSNTGYRGNSDAGYIGASPYNTPIGDTEDFKATSERFTFWSNEYNFVCNGNGEIIGEDKDISNPIGIIPIIDISQCKDFVYFVEQGSGVVEFCIDYNVALTDLMFISRLQGFAQGVVSGEKEVLDKMTTIQMGPAHIIKLPIGPSDGKETKLDFINRGSDIKGTQDSIEMLLSNFLTSKGIDPKTISGKGNSQSFSSGTERLLAMIDRFESSRADYDLFKTVETKIYEIIKTYVSTYSGTEFLDKKYHASIPEDSIVNVNYKKPELVQGEGEKTDTIIKKVDSNLMSKIEGIMELRGVSREKAEEIYQKIVEDNLGIEEPETISESEDVSEDE